MISLDFSSQATCPRGKSFSAAQPVSTRSAFNRDLLRNQRRAVWPSMAIKLPGRFVQGPCPAKQTGGELLAVH
ncbi:MAG: hypothetical protein N2C14_23880 [Planctomycetales bacterium]